MSKKLKSVVSNPALDEAVVKLPSLFKAFSLVKVKDGWSLVELWMDSDLHVTDATVTNPDMRAVATEAFKVAVGKYWMKQEG